MNPSSGNESYTFRLFSSLDRMRRVWQSITPCPELSKAQFGTLMVILHGGKPPHFSCKNAKNEPMALSTIANIMGQSLPSVSQRVTSLEQMGYLERVAHPSDRRICGVRLTPSGQKLMSHAFETIQADLDQAMAHLGNEQLETLFRLLDQLADELEQRKGRE